MLDAQAKLWLLADEALIDQAVMVLEASGEVLSASGSLTEAQSKQTQSATGRFKAHRKDPEVEAKLAEAVGRIGRECRKFARLMRAELQTPDIDALVRAFPQDQSRHSAALSPTDAVSSELAD